MGRRRGWAVALTGVATAAVLAGCGGSANPGKLDATAACQALARTTDLSHLTFQAGNRLSGAAELGLAAASENGKLYSNLGPVSKRVDTDVQTAEVGRLQSDVKAALATCKTDKVSTGGS